MDLSTTILGLLFLALFILPVILISKSGKGKTNKFEKEIFSEASKNELNISDKLIWKEFAIGIDASRKKIIYLDWSGPEKINLIIDLKDVKVFEPIPGSGEQNKKNFNYKKVDRLGFRFHFIKPGRSDLNIIFYIAGIGTLSEEEVKLYKKWLDIIRSNMVSKSIDDMKHSA